MNKQSHLASCFTSTAREQAITQALFQELSPRNLRYYIVSYGCQMNAHDSEKLAGMLVACGYTACNHMDEADLILFNTCCVREHAEKRVFGNIGALKKRKDAQPGLVIGVCGCMMQQHEVAERLYKRYPFVNFVFGSHSIHELPAILQGVLQGERPLSVHDVEGELIEGLPMLRAPGVSGSVNIIYGCDNYCSYCIVPYVRGRERSRIPSDILNEIQEIADNGYSEVQLLGQNVNSYYGGGEGQDFAWLLHQVNEISGIRRIRFMTSHPKDLSESLIEAMATLPHVCNHIHLPVQSGSNRILAAMNRRYTQEDYLRLVDKLRARVPAIEISTDFIVGFPGETETDMIDTLNLVEKVGFSAAFTFMYSPRTGTKASSLPEQVPQDIKKQRLLRLNALQELQTRKTNARYIGTVGEVLVEGCDFREKPMLYGKLSCFKMVYFPGEADKIGSYMTVRVDAVHKNSLLGTAVPER